MCALISGLPLRRLRAGLLAVVVGLAVACSEGKAQTGPPPTVTPIPTSPSTPDLSSSIDAAVMAAYVSTYADVTAAVRQRDATSKVLARHAIPPAEYQLQEGATQYLRLGVIPVGVPVLRAHVASLNVSGTPPSAVVKACPSASRLVSAKTGHVVGTRVTSLNPVTVDLQLDHGRWVVTFFKVDRKATCSG